MNFNPNRLLIILYFAVALVEIVAEIFAYKPVILVFKPLIPFLLIILYFQTSIKRNFVFVLALAMAVITNILFVADTEEMLFYGIIAFLGHRILVIYLVSFMVQIRDFIPVVIATIPFLLVFFYLFLITDEIPENSFFILIIQNLLISVLGGIAVSNYIMADNKMSAWLLVCGLLFVMLQLIIFIEKYYLSQQSPIILRPFAMGLNVFAFYTLYEFVIAEEKSDDNPATA